MTRMRNREVKQNYSSFILPVIIALSVIILIIKMFFWWASSNSSRTWSYVNVIPNQDKSEIYIFMSWDSKKQIDWQEKMFSTDNKAQVKLWEAKITIENNNSNIFLDKLGELKYEWLNDGKQTFSLLTSKLWAEVKSSNIEFKLKNIVINPDESSVLAFNQNAIASTVYVLKWKTNVKLGQNDSNSEKNIDLWVWQKMTIMNNDLNDENLNLSDKIEPIDDIFKTEDFFVKHNWNSYLESNSLSGTLTWSWNMLSWSLNQKNQKVIVFNNPLDESSIDWSSLDIDWKIISVDVEKITINDKEVSINKEERTFALNWFELDDKINNLVYKSYDKDNNLLAKWVIVVYSSWKTPKKEDEKPTVTTYPISDKDFKILEPLDNPFKTTDNIVKISWQVNKWVVKFITINWFRLTKFPQFASNWYYFANKDYWTMNDWINLYTIKYYWKDDELLSTNLFTIVKESSIKEEIEQIQAPATSTWSNNW
ncbi:MAG: hypothetical protein ACD_4C00114G0003 [uncultured bacterium (gcode 4)]|uniref:Uncharacterized protein n=1 Tax=uncultured bacterium (gcode 4) TaxID=1234023 RepID=K2FYG2_9BACT|nr:MAG: hypothetical protein ACD_4C00114G0003 [uncultured bacterium (gcode 4)]